MVFAQAQWQFDAATQKAYDQVMNLHLEQAMEMIPDPTTAQEIYVVSLAETLTLLLSEDPELFDTYETHFQNRLREKIKAGPNDSKFVTAELHLHWAFNYLKFGKELDAAKHLRESYQIAVACRSKSPEYLAIRKTTGLLELMIGSVPEKYDWVLDLFNMEGAIEKGTQELTMLKSSESPLAFEANVLFSLVQAYVFQEPAAAMQSLEGLLAHKPSNRMLLFTGASVAIKNSQGADALKLLDRLQSHDTGTPLLYADYLRGESYLYKGDYLKAIPSYRWFTQHFKGKNNLKDAYYKMGVCYLLHGNTNDAAHFFAEAKEAGDNVVEADRAAERSLSEPSMPPVSLSKARYATDGGYYDEAAAILNGIKDSELPERKSQVEYFYRKARLAHKQHQLSAAKLFYQQTIDLAADERWYFAPNASLQLGYILEREGQFAEAKLAFERAMSYKKHEYKNSIDSKSRSALERLKSN